MEINSQASPVKGRGPGLSPACHRGSCCVDIKSSLEDDAEDKRVGPQKGLSPFNRASRHSSARGDVFSEAVSVFADAECCLCLHCSKGSISRRRSIVV